MGHGSGSWDCRAASDNDLVWTRRFIACGSRTFLRSACWRLLCLGAVMVQSASMTVTGKIGWQWTAMGWKQAGFCVISMIVFLVVGRTDYSPPGTGGDDAAGLADASGRAAAGDHDRAEPGGADPGVGISKNGARRWLPLGIMQLQPSELAKWAVVMFLAWWLTTRPLDTDRFVQGFLPTLVPIVHAVPAGCDPGFRHGGADRDVRDS